jgi:cellulose synthase/poly-beta-1,6-N-acetylglucosamine synthase-like glycosyltransferase
VIDRPPVSVVVPFAGSDEQLAALEQALGALAVRPGDELVVSDNRRDPVHTPAYARNRGAAGARGEWLVFIDADTRPDPGLLDAYFDPPPGPRTAILAGGIRDVALRATAMARNSVSRAHMSQRTTLQRTGMPYAQTANCAIRREAFDAVGGFHADARAGEDADLCFRLQRAGWEIEERLAATVDHRARERLGPWLAQLARHGSGAAWVGRRWPGQFRSPGPRQLARRLARDSADAAACACRGDWRATADAVFDLIGALAFELGRLIPNTPRRRG